MVQQQALFSPDRDCKIERKKNIKKKDILNVEEKISEILK